MSRNWLNDSVWSDMAGTAYVMLDVTLYIAQQQSREYDGVLLSPKDEYHVSLVPTSKLTDNVEKQQEIIECVKQVLQRVNLTFSAMAPERYLCRHDGEMTLIAPVVIDGFDDFADEVCKVVPEYEKPFLHVTLLKSENSEYGIGVTSSEQLAQRCEMISS